MPLPCSFPAKHTHILCRKHYTTTFKFFWKFSNKTYWPLITGSTAGRKPPPFLNCTSGNKMSIVIFTWSCHGGVSPADDLSPSNPVSPVGFGLLLLQQSACSEVCGLPSECDPHPLPAGQTAGLPQHPHQLLQLQVHLLCGDSAHLQGE